MFLATFAVSSVSAQASRQSQKNDTITLKGDSLREVIVTARSLRGLSSGARIDRSAMEHLQPTSFADILELLPGHISLDPTMGSVNSILLRETGSSTSNGNYISNTDYNISSLGTLFMVDGAPINGDANLQSVPNAAGDGTVSTATRDITNKGVDMRSISTDNIESVEIIQGIPSVEYGNLTSGLLTSREYTVQHR